MAKNQAQPEPAIEEPESWPVEEAGDFEEAANDARSTPAPKFRLDMRHKIEDLIESRRLMRQIGDYESLDVDDASDRARRRRVH